MDTNRECERNEDRSTYAMSYNNALCNALMHACMPCAEATLLDARCTHARCCPTSGSRPHLLFLFLSPPCSDDGKQTHLDFEVSGPTAGAAVSDPCMGGAEDPLSGLRAATLERILARHGGGFDREGSRLRAHLPPIV